MFIGIAFSFNVICGLLWRNNPIANENVSDLPHLIRLCLISFRLQIQDFIYPIADKNMMIAFDSLREAKPLQQFP